MGVNEYRRHSARVTRSSRWRVLRMQALRRDDFNCVSCGSVHRLQVDHIEPVRDRPELAWDLDNLQTLCASCHSRKTIQEIGLSPLSPARAEWREMLRGPIPGRTIQQLEKDNPEC